MESISAKNDLKILSNFIFIFLAVFFKSAIDLIYNDIFPPTALSFDDIRIYKIIFLFMTLLYLIDDSIESQIINLRHPYKNTVRFF